MARVPKPQQVCPPDWDNFEWPSLTVLCFDQTLTNTGWALMATAPGKKPQVLFHGTLRTQLEGTQGFADNLRRVTEMSQQMAGVIDLICADWKIDWIVHEMPAVVGFRTDSSLMAATALHVVLGSREIQPEVRMVNNNKMKKWICNDHKASKAQVREGVSRALDSFRTNEHVADALALGLAEIAAQDYNRQLDEWRQLTTKLAR